MAHRYQLVFTRVSIIAAFLVAPSLFAQSADLAVSKNAPATATAGSTISYDITITNIGPDDAMAPEIDDTLPNGLIYVSGIQTAGTTMFVCSEPAVGATMGNFTCGAQTLPAGESATFTILETIPPDAVPGTVFNNTAIVFSMTPDPNSENDNVTVGTTVTGPQADISVSKSGPSSAAPGSDVAYTISVTNAGPDAGANVSLTDTLPGTMTFVSFMQNSGPAFNCGVPGATTTCTLASMPANSTATFTFTGNIPMGTAAGTSFQNTANVSADDDQSQENNSSSTQLTVATADLGISKSAPPMAGAGSVITYTITITNGGPNTASNVSFSDPLPAGVTFVSVNSPGGSCTTPGVGANGTVSCSVGDLNNGAMSVTTINVLIQSNVAAGTMLSNTATATSDTADPNGANNSSSATTTVTANADIAVTKTGGGMATAGANVSYTLTVINNGPSDAANVQVTDAAPAGTTFVSLVQNSGPTFNCVSTTCTIATLTNGATATFTDTVQVSPSTANGTMFTNTVNGSTTTTDPTPGNNSANASTTVSASADLAVTKTGGANASPGGPVSYTLTITNNGPSDAQNVSLSDPAPPNETFVSETQNTGPSFNCVGSTCTIASFAAGATATFTYNATVSPAALPMTMITNTATASTTTTDPTPGNNSASATTNVGFASVDMSIAKTVSSPPPYATGFQLKYNINVVNTTAGTPANSVTVTDVIPPGATFVSATPTIGSCTGTTTVTCNLGTIAGGAGASIALTITMPSTPGVLSNTATVSSANPDSNPANNTSTATVTVLPANEVPAASPLTLLLLGMALAAIAIRMSMSS